MKEKKYCGICDRVTSQDEDGCIYHQRIKYDSEEGLYLKYDEFNQDGEAW